MFIKPDLRRVNVSPEKLLDFHLLNNPHEAFGILASNDSPDKREIITWSELASAILEITSELHREAQTQALKAPVVGILVNGDTLAYYTLFWAILRSGCVPFPISPRNSAPAVVHLLTRANCASIYVQFNPTINHSPDQELSIRERTARKQTDEVLRLLPDSFALKLRQFPSAFKLYSRLLSNHNNKIKAKYQPDPKIYEKLSSIITPDCSAIEPILIMHSSGTTSFPKPIYISRLSLHAWLTAPLYNPKFNWEKQILAGMILPPFHAMGIHYGLIINLSTGAVPGFFHPELATDGTDVIKAANSVNVMEAIKSLGCTVAVISPFMLTELASDKSHIEILRKMHRVAFGGGPLSVEVGNKLVNEGVKLCVAYGSTEVGPTSSIYSEPYQTEKWDHFEISPHLVTRFVPQDESRGLYELVVLSSDKHRCSLSHAETELLPQTYHTNDILYKHPTLPLYRVVGRLDDQIMLSTSEKTNPGPMEAILVSNPAIKGALMFGRGKPANGVIIEPEEKFLVDVKDRKAVEKFIDLIWPSIEEANKFGPSHSRLTRNLILVTDPRVTPLPKTTKGQIARPKTLEILEKQIEEIYSSDESSVDQVLSGMKVCDDDTGIAREDRVLDCLEYIVKSVLEGDNVNLEQDLFSQGCDSLSAKHIRSRIIQLIDSSSQKTLKVPRNIVYQFPTVLELSQWVLRSLKPLENRDRNLDSDSCAPLRILIQRYSPIFQANGKPYQNLHRETSRPHQKLNPFREMTLARYIFN